MCPFVCFAFVSALLLYLLLFGTSVVSVGDLATSVSALAVGVSLEH